MCIAVCVFVCIYFYLSPFCEYKLCLHCVICRAVCAGYLLVNTLKHKKRQWSVISALLLVIHVSGTKSSTIWLETATMHAQRWDAMTMTFEKNSHNLWGGRNNRYLWKYMGQVLAAVVHLYSWRGGHTNMDSTLPFQIKLDDNIFFLTFGCSRKDMCSF